ncbi:MAG: hypothetical protein ACP5TF_01520 [Candidatus Acidifodinimicrobium sp.]
MNYYADFDREVKSLTKELYSKDRTGLALESCGVGVNIIGNGRLISKTINNKLIKKVITSPSISQINKNYPSVFVRYSKRFQLKEGYPKTEYSGDNTDNIISIAKHLLERKKQESGMYSIHGSAVSKRGKAIFLFGWKDTGKSSTAISLVKYKGFSFVSDGQATIDSNARIVGKVKIMEELSPYIKKNYKISESMEELVQDNQDEKPKIAAFVYPQISNSNLKTIWGYSEKSIFHMYELLSIEIRGVYSCYIDRFRRPLSSLDTVDLSVKRIALARRIAKTIPIIQIKGDMQFICDEAEKLV